MVRKRERENPCYVCGHFHKFEEGEVCGICGHRLQDAAEKSPQQSAFSTEILPSFLYLGSYDNASRSELLKAQGIKHILNMVPTCQNLYKNSFDYKTIKDGQVLPFDECTEFIENSRLENAPILVHCMSGQNRSPAVVIAYLMRYKGWRFPESYQWVKDRRPSINLSSAVIEQLHAYEEKIFGSRTAIVPNESGINFSFGFPAPTVAAFGTSPMFQNSSASSSLFAVGSGSGQGNFVFEADKHSQTNTDNTMESL